MREIRQSGSEGGETGKPVFPTPIMPAPLRGDRDATRGSMPRAPPGPAERRFRTLPHLAVGVRRPVTN
jgi:hypothetical protein